MPPAKAAKKSAKKSAKKAAGKHSPEHEQERHAKDTRRAYEHLGRVEILSSLVSGEHLTTVHELITLARTALAAKYAKNGADLLRAAEHLCFAAASDEKPADASVSKDLEATIKHEFEHLQEKAAEHASNNKMPSTVQTIFTFMSRASAAAMKKKSYRPALELARGAEALAHVDNNIKALPAGQETKRLT